MKNELSKIIKQFNGNVLAIGLDDKLIKILEKNNCINECFLLGSITKKGKGKLFSKTIKIKKIRKKFKKKQTNFIICNYEVIEKFLNSFVKDSIYLSDFKIYYYNVKDSSKLEKRYKRYDTTININKDIVEIDSSKAKNNYFMDKLYVISDIIEIIIEVIGDVLMN